MHSTTYFSPFEIIYGFNPLTPFDLVPLPSNEQTNLDGAAKAKLVRDMHEKVRDQIIKKNEHYARLANRGRRHVSFEPGDWVWVHMRKERFPTQQKTKLHPQGDGPFQVVARVGDNAYKLDLPGDYGVSATFNVSDLSSYEFDTELLDSRTSPSQEGGNDENKAPQATTDGAKDALRGISGPMTRARTKKVNEAMNNLILEVHDQEERLSNQVVREYLMISAAEGGHSHSVGK